MVFSVTLKYPYKRMQLVYRAYFCNLLHVICKMYLFNLLF